MANHGLPVCRASQSVIGQCHSAQVLPWSGVTAHILHVPCSLKLCMFHVLQA